MPSVSVIIPTYNRCDLLKKSIDSVVSQTHPNIEIIVVDDNSTDNTYDMVRNYSDQNIKYICHNKNKGVSAARNTGIKAASGKYLAFIDSDDVWLPQKIEKQLKAVQGSPIYKAVYCRCVQESDNNPKNFFSRLFPEKNWESGGRELSCDILSQRLPIHPGSSLLLESKIINKIGYFDEDLPRQEDLEFMARLLTETQIKYIDEPLVNLYDTGRPKTNVIVRSRVKYVRKSVKYLDSMEEYDVFINSQRRLIANAYLRDGNFRKALKFLRRSKFNTRRDYAATVFHTLKGIKNVSSSLI